MNQQEILELIEQAATDGRAELDLSNNGLTELPPTIGKLIDLASIDISYNQLETLPKEIKQLTNLVSIDLSWNPLSTEFLQNAYFSGELFSNNVSNYIFDKHQITKIFKETFIKDVEDAPPFFREMIGQLFV